MGLITLDNTLLEVINMVALNTINGYDQNMICAGEARQKLWRNGFYEEFRDELDFDPDFVAEYGDEDDNDWNDHWDQYYDDDDFDETDDVDFDDEDDEDEDFNQDDDDDDDPLSRKK